jgi:hypothetical protein
VESISNKKEKQMLPKNTARWAVLAATVFLTMIPLKAASAETLAGFTARLQAAGLSVLVDPSAVSYEATQPDGRKVTIERAGQKVVVEFIEYESQAALQEDWIAVNGQGPKPRTLTSEFAGKDLYWNQQSILVGDFRTPNDSSVMKSVGDIFLGRSGADAKDGSISPPATGDGGLVTAAKHQRTSEIFTTAMLGLVVGGVGFAFGRLRLFQL